MRRRLLAAATVIAAVAVSLTVAAPSFADDYPTWQDVQRARASVSAQKVLIERIDAAIDQVNEDLAAAETLVRQRGQEAADAQEKADAAALTAADLQRQAESARQDADEAKRQAGVIAAALARSGGQDLTLTLFASGEDSADLLYKLGTMSKLGELTRQLFNKATTAMNTAASLSDQAEVAQAELLRLSGVAQAALQTAVDAQTAYQKKLEASQETLATLQQQLIVIEQKRDATEADYQAGVAYRKKLAEEAARRNAGAGSSIPGSSGWANPITVSHQWISSRYGMRADPFGGGGYGFHYGTDIAVACGTSAYTAYGGQVTFAGWYGSVHGNVVIVSHGGGVQTMYAHLQSFGTSVGASVKAGQYIARVGATGAATGCHLHFQVMLGGTTTDSLVWMQDRGITLGRP